MIAFALLFWRRSLPVLLLLLAALPLPAATLEEAAALYEQGQFVKAKEAWESLAASQPSANVYYNLGNTEFRLGAPGRAILQYERALLLQPDHAEARLNLDFVRRSTGAKAPEQTWLGRGVSWWPEFAWTIAAAVAGWLAVFAAIALFRGRQENLLLWSVALVALVCAAWSGVALWWYHGQRAGAVIVAASAPARVQPADRSDVVQTLPAGTRVKVLLQRSGWVYCELPGRAPGWIAHDALESLYPAT